MTVNKRALGYLGLGASLIGAVCAGAAIAASYSTETNYYSDASYSEMVGGEYTQCSGSTTSWGQQTPYYDTVSEPCQAGPTAWYW